MNYQEALDRLRNTTRKGWENKNDEKAVAILQELVNEKLEQESRKEKLIIGSEWVCVCKTYGTVKILDAHPFSENVTFGDMIFSRTEKIDDFILCFKPLKEGE